MVEALTQISEVESLPQIRPMLPRLTHDLPSNPKKWISEIKWDGARALVYLDQKNQHYQICSKGGRKITEQFPEFTAGFYKLLTSHSLIFDGEIVFGSNLDQLGKKGTGSAVGERLVRKPPRTNFELNPLQCHYLVFDLMYLDGEILIYKPLEQRKKMLTNLFKNNRRFQNKHGIVLPPYFDGADETMVQSIIDRGYEGVVLKRKDSIYHQGLSSHWLKIKA